MANNIQHVNRYGNGGLQMDNMDYKYETNGSGNLISNRLYHVNDPISAGNYADDIDGQGTFVAVPGLYNYKNNYSYDELGNLRKDSIEGIKDIKWTLYGKIKEVTRYPGSTKPDIEFMYDVSGNRIVKIVKPKPLNCATYNIIITFVMRKGTNRSSLDASS